MTEEELAVVEKQMEGDSLKLTILCDRAEQMTETETLLAAAHGRERALIAGFRKFQKVWASFVVDKIEADREACAKIADDWRDSDPLSCGKCHGKIAAKIRARGGPKTAPEPGVNEPKGGGE